MKRAAVALVIIILLAGVSVFILYRGPQTPPDETELVDDPSQDKSLVIINEVHPDESTQDEFIELFTTGQLPDMTNWILTTYDDDIITLPTLTGNSKYLYLRVFTGVGTNDLDINDNQATVYAGLNSSILDPSGDEVGIHDASGLLVDFMRYGGGNGDPILGDWNDAMDGPNPPASDESLSYFPSDDLSDSWVTGPMTPGEPNALISYTSGQYGGDEIWFINGVRTDIQTTGFDESLMQGDNITVRAGPGVNRSVINLISEHINFSVNLYRQLGFGEPNKDSQGRIRVRLVSSTSVESTASANPNGTIIFRVGTNATREELKLVGEHEMMHQFHFKRYNDSTGTFRHVWFYSRWFVEGQAEFWGMTSMLRNYPNMTMTSWMRMAKRLGSLNWFDHYRDLNASSPFERWVGTWNDYMASFLFTKWLNETFGPNTLLRIFNETKYYGSGDSRNVSPETALQRVLNMTLEQALIRFWSWLILDAHKANGVPLYEPHVRMNYTDGALNDTVWVRGKGGAVIEEVNITGESPFTLRLNWSYSSDKWVASVLVFYEDGTNETIIIHMNSTSKTGIIHLNPNAPKRISRIWVIKGVTTRYTQRITMTITPDYNKTLSMTYEGQALNDTVELQPEESAFEVININNSTSFSMFLNWSGGNNKHLNITIIRYWSDGTNDTQFVEILNNAWPGYILDPDAGSASLTKLIVIKQNLNDTAFNITMTVTPANETPPNAMNPIRDSYPYLMCPTPWDIYGGILAGYSFLNSSYNYDFYAEIPTGAEFTGLILSYNLTIIHEFFLTADSQTVQLIGPEIGIYYFVITSGPPEGLIWYQSSYLP